MRVLFLLTQDLESPSGLGRFLPLARELVRLGYQVSLAALHPNIQSLQQTRFESAGVRVWYVAPMHVQKQGNDKKYYSSSKLLLLAAQATWQLSYAALSIPADVIYICKPHPMNSLAGLIAGRLRGVRLYLDCDDYEAGSNRFGAGWQRRGVSLFEKEMPHHVHRITTNTFFMREKLLTWGVPSEQIVFIPNGVDRNRFLHPDLAQINALRNKLSLSGKRVVAFIGSLSLPSHPVNLLIDAMVQVCQTQPDVVLLIVGGGEDYLRLRQYVQKLGLAESVRFCGRIPSDQVPLYYRLADVSVDPVHDNDVARGRSPLKLFESWASEVPFITADVGDRQMLMGSPSAGVLIQPGNTNALADAILNVISNREYAETLRHRGFGRVEDFYWDRLAQRLASIYD